MKELQRGVTVIPQRLLMTIEVPPSVNANVRARKGSLRNDEKPIIHISSEVAAYKKRMRQLVEIQVKAKRWPIFTDDWYGILYPVPVEHLRTSDLDNYLKVGFDCLVAGFALYDDSRVISIMTYKVPAPPEAPMTLTIYRLALPKPTQMTQVGGQVCALAERSEQMYQQLLKDAGLYSAAS